MSRLLYATVASLDGSVDDAGGGFDWAARIWQAADKVVCSRTLDAVSGERTTLERDFDVAEALRAGIVDELRLLTVPVVVGGGTRSLPDGIRLDLELLDQRRFARGTTYERYAVRR